jgi:uncharacterized BrkB/YihY/UPF0761 family membrane protein
MLLLQTTPTAVQSDPSFHLLALVMGWTVTVLIGAFAIAIIYKMLKGDINLMYLIAGADGDASLSRFQFLIFTFVIALGLFLIILAQPTPEFPDRIPGGILALLGISGASYVTSKAVDANAAKPPAMETNVVVPAAAAAPGQTTNVIVPPPG